MTLPSLAAYTVDLFHLNRGHFGVILVMEDRNLEALKLLLETQKIQRELEKIEFETKALVFQQTRRGRLQEWLKSLAGIGAAITELFALFGLWFSVAASRDSAVQSRIAKALDSLSVSNIAKRLSGMATLQYFLAERKPEIQRQILQITANLLAIEKEQIVRDSMLSLFASLESRALTNTSWTIEARRECTEASVLRTLVFECSNSGTVRLGA